MSVNLKEYKNRIPIEIIKSNQAIYNEKGHHVRF